MDQAFQHGSAVVSLGQAPDGLPLRLFIDRGPSAAELLEPLARRIGYQTGPYQGTPFEPVVDQMDELIRRAEMQIIQTGDQEVECYVCRQPAWSILGATLLQRILGGTGTMIAPAGARPDTRTVPAPTTLEPRPLRADVGTGYLAIPLKGGNPLVVRKIENLQKLPTFLFGHVYQPEAILNLATARFEAHFRFSGEHYSGLLSDAAEYGKARYRLFTANEVPPVCGSVDRAEVVRIVVELARQLDALHRSGEVHGDVKPANALITPDGVRVIDSLHLTPARISPAMTPGWAAPEQVTGDPVSFATDQYPIGVMLCDLLKAVKYGEEVTYLIPVAAGRLERFTFLRSPGAYLHPNQGTLSEQGIEAWRSLIDRCLRFCPADRFGSMAELAAKLEEVATAHPPLGTCPLDLTFGQLVSNPELAWQRSSSSTSNALPPIPFFERT